MNIKFSMAAPWVLVMGPSYDPSNPHPHPNPHPPRKWRPEARIAAWQDSPRQQVIQKSGFQDQDPRDPVRIQFNSI